MDATRDDASDLTAPDEAKAEGAPAAAMVDLTEDDVSVRAVVSASPPAPAAAAASAHVQPAADDSIEPDDDAAEED